MQKNPRIREVCYGIYEGAMPAEAYAPAAKALGYDSVDTMMGAVMSGAMTINEAVSAMAKTDESKTAETWETAQKRVMEGLREIADEAARKGQNQVLVVSHGWPYPPRLPRLIREAEAGGTGQCFHYKTGSVTAGHLPWNQ